MDVAPRPATRSNRPTLADVAAAAGVSRTTASNAYNRPDQLSARQREKVLAVAGALGYAGPDPMARSLRTRSAAAVGLIFGAPLSLAFSDPAAVEFLHGVAQACEQRGRSLLLVPAGREAANRATVERAAVDGFLIYSMPEEDPHVQAVLARPQAAVVVDSPIDIPNVDFIGIDDRAAFASVAEHVLALGHRSIGLISMGADSTQAVPGTDTVDPTHADPWTIRHSVFRQRLLGMDDALRRHRATAGASTVRVRRRIVAVNDGEYGRLMAADLLACEQPPTAIMCMSDVLAFGVLAELTERGIDVPGQITVTGFDDVPDSARRGLTTVAQPTHEKGWLAAELLLDRPEATALPTRRILDTQLMVRTSSGAPPGPTSPTPQG